MNLVMAQLIESKIMATPPNNNLTSHDSIPKLSGFEGIATTSVFTTENVNYTSGSQLF